MALNILDTDILTLLRQGNSNVIAHLQLHAKADITTTVITVEEYLTGWYSLIRQAKRPEHRELAYRELADSVMFFSHLRIIAYTQLAMTRYELLSRLRLNIGAMDLRIASIVLEEKGVLVTRNLRDFQRVPGLPLEDWTQPLEVATENGQSEVDQPPQ